MKMENPYREDGRNNSRWQLNTDLQNKSRLVKVFKIQYGNKG